MYYTPRGKNQGLELRYGLNFKYRKLGAELLRGVIFLWVGSNGMVSLSKMKKISHQKIRSFIYHSVVRSITHSYS